MAQLSEQRCEACHAGTPKVTQEEAREFRAQLDPGWKETDGASHSLHRRLTFPDFRRAFALASAIADLAEDEGHHPDLCFGWGYLDITTTTHAVQGLTRNDFILAAKIDKLLRSW